MAVLVLAWVAGCDRADEPDRAPAPTGETGTTSSVPSETGTTAPPPPPEPLELCINELLPSNATALADDRGGYPDWFELHNPGAEEVGLGGWTVADDDTIHALDAALSIAPGGFLVLYADGDVAVGPDHVGFQLSGDGERLGLFAPDGRGSVVEWDALETDQALARVSDCCAGEGCWTAVARGSPGATNAGPVLVEEAVVARGSSFRSWPGPGLPPAGWEQPSFDDAGWPEGPAPLGYGGDEATTVPVAPAAMLRRTFEVATTPVSAVLRLRRDDGVVVWLDGAEILRDNLPTGPLGPATTASSPVDGAGEVVWEGHALDPALLPPGPHTLAISVVQAVPDGDDLLLDAELLVGAWSEP